MNGSKNKNEPRLAIERILSTPARAEFKLKRLLAVFAGAAGLVALDVWALKNVVQTTGEGILIVALAAANIVIFTRAAEILNRGH